MYRIFIVEDDAAIASTLARQIQRWGYEVRCAEHFQDILSEFQSFDPQLVLLDLMLPFYNGYHWCSEIRKTFTCADSLSVFCLRQYEHRDGYEYGWR